MKKINLLLFFLLFTFYHALTQQFPIEGECGTPEFRIPTVHHSIGSTSQTRSGTSTLYIPITINILGTDNGTGYSPVHKILDELCELQTDFEEHNLHFYIENINYVDNSDFYDMAPYPGYVFTETMYDFIEANNSENTMNVYIVKHCGGPSGFVSFEDFAGWDYSTYPPPWLHTQDQGIVLDSDYFDSRTHIFTHEVGHFFGLYHTFFGDWDDFKVSGTPDTVYYEVYDPLSGDTIPQFWLVERVADDSCHMTGDLICDTPPDYLGRFTCGGANDVEQLDPDGTPFHSDGTLYMSYSNDDCQERFSPMQVEVMRAVAEGPRDYLLYNQTPPNVLSVDSLTLNYPANNEMIAVTDSITLEWNMPGADFYLVDFGFMLNGAFISTQTNVYLTDNSYKVPLRIGREFYWIVRGLSNYFPCEIWKDTSYFSIESTTAARDIDLHQKISIYPNPATKELHLDFRYPTIENTPIEVQLFDIQGRMVKKVNVLVSNPALNIEDLSSGLYSLKVITNNSLFTSKFVKQ